MTDLLNPTEARAERRSTAAGASRATVTAVSARLFKAMSFVMGMLFVLFAVLLYANQVVISPIILACGAMGAFVSLQQRLKGYSEEDLQLFMDSLPYTLLAPLVGAILAIVLFLIFLSGLLAGELFPEFPLNRAPEGTIGLISLFYQYSDDPADYAKLLFWSFVAGYSERLVIDIIGRFSTQAVKG